MVASRLLFAVSMTTRFRLICVAPRAQMACSTFSQLTTVDEIGCVKMS